MREGDTIEKIAHRVGTTPNRILDANPSVKPDRLKIGSTILIPASPAPSASKRAVASQGQYKVRNGESDWTISKKLGISVEQLHRLNPGVKWTAVQIGQLLNVPSANPVASATTKASSSKSPKVAHTSHHTVAKGENDWIIAAHFGTTMSQLHAINPGVNWRRLQPGQVLNVPGGKAQAPVVATRIRTRNAKVTGDGVSVRRAPGANAPKIVEVDAGTIAKIVDRDGNWYKLQFPKGTIGWVRGDLLAAVERKAVAVARVEKPKRASRRSTHGLVASSSVGDVSDASVLGKAKQYLGVRYRYGGTSRSGFDCSGFVGHVYRQSGVSLPRTAAEQSRVGKKVSKGELSKGDLVFFKTNRGTRINHVGIYVGNGKFIHASSGGGHVEVDSLNEGYYARRFAGAKRVASKSSGSKKSQAKESAKDETSSREPSSTVATPGADAVAP